MGAEKRAWLKVGCCFQHQASRIRSSYHWTLGLQARQARSDSQEPRGPLGIRPVRQPPPLVPVVLLFLHPSPVHVLLVAPGSSTRAGQNQHAQHSGGGGGPGRTSSPSSSAPPPPSSSSTPPSASASSSSPPESSWLGCWASPPPAGLDSPFSAEHPSSRSRSVPCWDRYPAGTSPGPADLVLQAVSPPLQVHLLGVGVVEAALTQLAVEADDLALVVADLEEAPAG